MKPYVQISIIPAGRGSHVMIQVFDGAHSSTSGPMWEYALASGRPSNIAPELVADYVHGILRQLTARLDALAVEARRSAAAAAAPPEPQLRAGGSGFGWHLPDDPNPS